MVLGSAHHNIVQRIPPRMSIVMRCLRPLWRLICLSFLFIMRISNRESVVTMKNITFGRRLVVVLDVVVLLCLNV